MATTEGRQAPSGKQGSGTLTPIGIRGAASAPGKCILLGEHAVVYGEPCLSVALDLRTTVVARAVGDRFMVNGYPLDPRYHAYFRSTLDQVWHDGPPVRFETASKLASTSGLGSSAALTTATVGALARLRDEWDPAGAAQSAFLAERHAQGAGSPNDTSVATAGGAVLLTPEKESAAGLQHLWTIELAGDGGEVARRWEVHRMEVPDLALVVGVTDVRGKTSEQVTKVRRFVERSGFGKDIVKDIGRQVMAAVDALRAHDHEALGQLMDRCQGNLHTLGVNHPALQRLIDAARHAEGTLGAKLTGAGGGGSMVCLTTNPEAAFVAIEAAGGRALRVVASNSGLVAETELELADSLPDTTEPVAPDEAYADADMATPNRGTTP